MTLTIPTITTERLLMRGFQPGDEQPLAAIQADPEVLRYIGDGAPLTPVASWRSLALHIGHWHLRGYGNWAVVERATGRMIGRAGLWNPEGWPGLEVGWLLARDQWGKGYATEAARAAVHHAFTTLGADHLISIIRPTNAASIRVAEKVGETYERTARVGGREVSIYGLDRTTWQSA
jgi:RimJ/RimL family protein N-acetyltransferase